MLVVVLHEPSKVNTRTLEAVMHLWPGANFVRIHNRAEAKAAIDLVWTHKDGFILCAPDFEPTEYMAHEFEHCKHDWCGFSYAGTKERLALQKFSSQLLTTSPQIPLLSRTLYPMGHTALDTKIDAALVGAGYEPYIHTLPGKG